MTKPLPPTQSVSPSADSPDAYRELSRRVKRVDIFRKLNVSAALLFGLPAAVALVFLAFSLSDIYMKFDRPGRIMFWLIGFGGGAIALGVSVMRYLLVRSRAIRNAIIIERAHPQLENAVSTAIEFGSDPEKTRRLSSPELVGELVRTTEHATRDMSAAGTVKWLAAGSAFLAAACLAGAVIAYHSASPRLFSTTLARFIRPLSNTPAPTITLIDRAGLADTTVKIEDNYIVRARVRDNDPGSAMIAYYYPDDPDEDMESVNPQPGDIRTEDMPPDSDTGGYGFTFHRLRKTVRYRIRSGDDVTDWYTIHVVRVPDIDTFTVTLNYPAFLGKAPETQTPMAGSISALTGTRVVLEGVFSGNVASVHLVFHRAGIVPAVILPNSRFRAEFTVNHDDVYAIHLFMPQTPGIHGLKWDERGARLPDNPAPLEYRIRARKNALPRVRIETPGKDQIVFKDGTLKTGKKLHLKITATDDYHLNRIGVRWTLAQDMTEKTFLDGPAPNTTTMEYDGEFPLKFSKVPPGAIITYYAFAEDVTGIGGDGRLITREVRSDVRFLMTYDKNEYDRYENEKKKSQQGKNDAMLAPLEKLIRGQKTLVRKTFREAAAQLERHDATPANSDPAVERRSEQRIVTDKLTAAQRALASSTRQLIADVEEALARDDLFGEKKKDAYEPDAGGAGNDSGMGPDELKLMKRAADKMDAAAGRLSENDRDAAIPPEAEALRLLSETRRVVMSNGAGSPLGKAMQQAGARSGKRARQARERNERDIRAQLADMPDMLETMRDLKEELARLEREQNPPANPPRNDAEPEKNRKRRLKDKMAQTRKKLDQAREKVETARKKTRRLADKDPRLSESAPRNMDDAAQQLDNASEAIRSGKQADAKNNVEQARKHLERARNAMAQSLNDRQEEKLRAGYRNINELIEEQRAINRDTRQLSAGQKVEQNPPSKDAPPQHERDAQMKRLAERQKDIRMRLKDINAQLKQLAESEWKTPDSVQEEIQRAERRTRDAADAAVAMREAGDALSRAMPDRAVDNQQRALDALKQIRKSAGSAVADIERDTQKRLGAAAKTLSGLEQNAQEARAQAMRNSADMQAMTQQDRKLAEAARQAASEMDDSIPMSAAATRDQVVRNLRTAADRFENASRQPPASDAARISRRNARDALTRARRTLDIARAERVRKLLDELKDTADRAAKAENDVAALLKTASLPETDSRDNSQGDIRRENAGERVDQNAEVPEQSSPASRSQRVPKSGTPSGSQPLLTPKSPSNRETGSVSASSPRPELGPNLKPDTMPPVTANRRLALTQAQRAAERAAERTSDMKEGLRRLARIFDAPDQSIVDFQANDIDAEFNRRRIDSRARELAGDAARMAGTAPDSTPHPDSKKKKAAGTPSGAVSPDSSDSDRRRLADLSQRAEEVSEDLNVINRQLDAFMAELEHNDVNRFRQAIEQTRSIQDELERLAAKQSDTENPAVGKPADNSSPESKEKPDSQRRVPNDKGYREPLDNARLAEKLQDIQRELAGMARRFNARPVPLSTADDSQPGKPGKMPDKSRSTPSRKTDSSSKTPGSELAAAAERMAELNGAATDPNRLSRPTRADIMNVKKGVQRAGDSLGVELERVLKSLRFDAVSTEQAPAEYEKAIADYFQALSDDKSGL